MDNNKPQNLDIEFIKDLVPMDTIGDEFIIFGDITNMPLFDYPSRTNAVVFAICLKGVAELSINLKNITLRENTFIVIVPDQITQFLNKSDDLSIRCFAMSQRFIEDSVIGSLSIVPLTLHIMDNPCTSLNESELSLLLDYHTFLWSKVKAGPSPYLKKIIQGLLQALCYEVSSIFNKHQPLERPKKTRKEEIFEMFLNEVIQNFKTNRNVAFYAEKLRLTPKHLSSTIKEATGKPAGEWIDSYVILEAKALLKTPNKTIQQIADELNFANQSFFGKYFKQHTGMSPSQYKAS